LPVAVIVAIGSVEDETYHRRFTRVIRELMAVTNEIFAKWCTGGGITGADEVAVAERAQEWVIELYQPLLGLRKHGI